MKDLTDLPLDLVDEAALVSRADASGKITYVNKKFCEVSGWPREEVIGRDHNIVKSGVHAREFWDNMYRTTVVEGRIWNAIVTNKSRAGRLYHVDTYIKAEFGERGELLGYTSIRQDVTKIYEALADVSKKNAYLEHAAKILRHDMHSGINTYIPRGVSSLERRLPKDLLEKHKLHAPLRLIREGLTHTQRVYKGVKEFTNLVRDNKSLDVEPHDLREILLCYLSSTAYNDQVVIRELPTVKVNESLFCTAIDNLIRNGLKYNDSETKVVWIYMLDEDTLVVEDNGRGMSKEEFVRLSQPYTRPIGQKEKGTGLGLSICIAILNEHGFSIDCEKLEHGTMLKVRLKC
jgi:two-component system, sensor histidine kinase